MGKKHSFQKLCGLDWQYALSTVAFTTDHTVIKCVRFWLWMRKMGGDALMSTKSSPAGGRLAGNLKKILEVILPQPTPPTPIFVTEF